MFKNRVHSQWVESNQVKWKLPVSISIWSQDIKVHSRSYHCPMNSIGLYCAWEQLCLGLVKSPGDDGQQLLRTGSLRWYIRSRCKEHSYWHILTLSKVEDRVCSSLCQVSVISHLTCFLTRFIRKGPVKIIFCCDLSLGIIPYQEYTSTQVGYYSRKLMSSTDKSQLMENWELWSLLTAPSRLNKIKVTFTRLHQGFSLSWHFRFSIWKKD